MRFATVYALSLGLLSPRTRRHARIRFTKGSQGCLTSPVSEPVDTVVLFFVFGWLALSAGSLACGVVLIRRGRRIGWIYVGVAVLLLVIGLLPGLLRHRVI